MREAVKLLHAGSGDKAFAVLEELGNRHPDGVLREERLAARVLALCSAGRTDEAREAGHRFVSEMPKSLQIARVRASCAFEK